jgi:hypothetical protein
MALDARIPASVTEFLVLLKHLANQETLNLYSQLQMRVPVFREALDKSIPLIPSGAPSGSTSSR